MVRCVVHDTTHEPDEPCPLLGTPTLTNKDGDCEKHRAKVVKAHEKKRVLADGGKWDDARQQAIT